MREIQLTQGKVALVDDEDYKRVMAAGKWSANEVTGGYWRAVRRVWDGDRKWQIGQYMSRFIMNAPTHLDVDHRNHDTLDNRRCNIRLCTTSQNMQNQRKRSGSSSKYKGVYWRGTRKCWRADIRINGRPMFLGHFANEEDAARAYNKAATQLFGGFALLNGEV